MSGRVQKAKRQLQQKSSETALAHYVANCGNLGPMPCSNCYRAGLRGKPRECVVADASKRCDECISRKIGCDGVEFADALIKNVDRLKELEEEEDRVLARLLAIKREKRVAKGKADELFKRGSLIVGSDPASRSGEAVTPSAAGPPDSEVAGFSDFDWSTLDLSLIDQTCHSPGAAGDPFEGSPRPSAAAP